MNVTDLYFFFYSLLFSLVRITYSPNEEIITVDRITIFLFAQIVIFVFYWCYRSIFTPRIEFLLEVGPLLLLFAVIVSRII